MGRYSNGPRDASPTGHDLGEWAGWYFDLGLRVGEDKPRSKHTAKLDERDDGARRTRTAVRRAWEQRPTANVAIRLDPQQDPEVCIVCLDADGAEARRYVEAELAKAGVLEATPKCTRPGGDGAKYLLRVDTIAAPRTARLLVPGCRNEGHDGLELLAFGRKATVAPSVHPDGHRYVWEVALPPDLMAIPTCPPAVLALPRKETVVVAAALTEDLRLRTAYGDEKTVAECCRTA